MTRKIKITNTLYPDSVPNGTIMTITGWEPNGCVTAVKDGDTFPWFIDAGTFRVLDKPIKLEVGKWYELNNGDVVECKGAAGDFCHVGRWAYGSSGVWLGGYKGSPLSVKREVPAPALKTGTLSELEVRDGDVVEFIKGVDGFAHYTEEFGGTLSTVNEYGGTHIQKDGSQGWSARAKHTFRIVSRATQPAPSQAPTMWRDMTDAEKGALLLAKHEGKVIEKHLSGDTWVVYRGCIYDDFAYRVKPEHVRDTVTLTGGEGTGYGFYQHGGAINTHKITFDTVDGVPVCDSIRMEETE